MNDQKQKYQYQDNDKKKNHYKVTFRKYKKQRYHYQENNNVIPGMIRNKGK